MRSLRFAALLLVPVVAAAACMRFAEDEMRTVTADSGADATVADTSPETAPSMCDGYGGFATIEKAMTDLVPKLRADCRIDRFFASMAEERVAHMKECMALQLGSIMRCSRDGVRIKYPTTDSKGTQCRDMKGSHGGLGIHNEDFDAMIDDILAVLADAKVSAEDVATIADVLRFQRTDIVNPGDAGRGDACKSETTAPADTGEDPY